MQNVKYRWNKYYNLYSSLILSLKNAKYYCKKRFWSWKKNSSKNSNIRIITFRIFGNSNCQKKPNFYKPYTGLKHLQSGLICKIPPALSGDFKCTGSILLLKNKNIDLGKLRCGQQCAADGGNVAYIEVSLYEQVKKYICICTKIYKIFHRQSDLDWHWKQDCFISSCNLSLSIFCPHWLHWNDSSLISRDSTRPSFFMLSWLSFIEISYDSTRLYTGLPKRYQYSNLKNYVAKYC